MSELKVWFERGKNLVFSATGFFPVSNLGNAYNYNYIHLDDSEVVACVKYGFRHRLSAIEFTPLATGSRPGRIGTVRSRMLGWIWCLGD